MSACDPKRTFKHSKLLNKEAELAKATAVQENGTYGGQGKAAGCVPPTAFAVLRIEFDLDQCANCDGVVEIISRAFVARCFPFLTGPPKLGGLFL
jgi:hypothetical protein